jgi:hypothetical protein
MAVQWFPGALRCSLEQNSTWGRQLVATCPPTSGGSPAVFCSRISGDGQTLPDIFIEDQLHLNEKSQAIWAATIAPVLKRGEAGFEAIAGQIRSLFLF